MKKAIWVIHLIATERINVLEIMMVMYIDKNTESKEVFVEAVTLVNPAINVQCIKNADDAKRKLSTNINLPTYIFLNDNMSFSGKELISDVKNSAQLSNIKIIIFSDSLTTETIQEYKRAGATAFMPKPVTIDDLQTILSIVFRMHKDF